MKLILLFIVEKSLIPCNIKEKNPHKRTVTDKNTTISLLYLHNYKVTFFYKLLQSLGNHPFFLNEI